MENTVFHRLVVFGDSDSRCNCLIVDLTGDVPAWAGPTTAEITMPSPFDVKMPPTLGSSANVHGEYSELRPQGQECICAWVWHRGEREPNVQARTGSSKCVVKQITAH